NLERTAMKWNAALLGLLLAGIAVATAADEPLTGTIAYSHLAGNPPALTIHLADAGFRRDRAAPGIRSLAVHPALSPDGQQQAFSAAGPEGDWALFTIRTDGKGMKRLVGRAVLPTWSPDGRQVAYVTQDVPSTIGVVNADGTGAKGLPARRLVAVGPFWSPD